MDGSMFRGLDTFLLWLCIFAAIGLIFGIWKIIEIVFWLYHHISIVWS
jgi:hypothetical protein